MHRPLRLCVFVLLGCAVLAQEKPAPNDTMERRPARRGELAASVRSATKPDQSYALYVPSNYVPQHSWPIIYVFDPGAHGSRPLELMKAAAEQYGYLLAGSNNSRNGSSEVQSNAAQEMWNDTHSWLAIDEHRVYFAGFSGGARVSAQLAQRCNCAQGVFLNGAGFGSGMAPSRTAAFPVFAMAGMTDFNYGELAELDSQLDALGVRHFFRRFDGGHAWAPAEVWQEALAWMALTEMKDGRRPRDGTFITEELARATSRARKREEAGELYFAQREYRSVAAAFAGLADTAALDERVRSLEKNTAVRAGAKQEKSEIEKQRTLVGDIFNLIDRLRTTRDDENALNMDALTRVRGLREDALKEKRPDLRRVFERALGEVFIGTIENGGNLMEAGQYRAAELYFQLAAEARPEWSWAHLSLARCHAASGDRKGALRDLKRARDTGMKPAELADFVKANPKLVVLMDTPEYQKLVASTPEAK